jgi:uncharacterized protein (TIGR00730 family)
MANDIVISVFGSSAPIEDTDAYRQAHAIGRIIADRGWTVCNGGYGGTMEASARGAVEAGGKVIGVTSAYYRSTVNRFVTEEIRTKNVIERLLRLVELAHGYVVLPGGTGTLLELATVWEYINKGVITPRPIVVYKGFWHPVVETINAALINEGKGDRTSYVRMFGEPEEAAEILGEKI